MVQLRGMGVWIKGKAVGMETYLGGGINRLGECKLWGEEVEETAIPLPYPLGPPCGPEGMTDQATPLLKAFSGSPARCLSTWTWGKFQLFH